MAYALFGARSSAAILNPLALAVGWLRRAREAHRRRMALQLLLELDAGRLDDLGLSRDEILAAMAARSRSPGAILAAHRTRRAHAWREH
jgi:uncharacterized protein YjiS (DUF1127 family)